MYFSTTRCAPLRIKMASNASHRYLPFHKFYCLSLSGPFPRSLASILILIHLHIPNSLNKLGELAVSEILHIKIVVLIVDPVAEFADPDSLSSFLVSLTVMISL